MLYGGGRVLPAVRGTRKGGMFLGRLPARTVLVAARATSTDWVGECVGLTSHSRRDSPGTTGQGHVFARRIMSHSCERGRSNLSTKIYHL